MSTAAPGALCPLSPQGLDGPSAPDNVSSTGPGRPPCGLLEPLAPRPGPKQREAASFYLGLAQEIHRLQVLHVPPMGPEDLTPGDLPRLQGDHVPGEHVGLSDFGGLFGPEVDLEESTQGTC